MAMVTVYDGWEPIITVGLRLRALRKDLGRRRGHIVSQAEMAEFLGVGAKAYGAWEADRNEPPEDSLIQIAERCAIRLAWLKEGESRPTDEAPNLQIKSLMLWPVELAAQRQAIPGQMDLGFLDAQVIDLPHGRDVHPGVAEAI